MNVLMLGWEFPPYNVGGLGVACHGLTKSLSNHGENIIFVMPKLPKKIQSHFLEIVNAAQEEVIHTIEIPALLSPYITTKEYAQYKSYIDTHTEENLYSKNLFEEVQRYALQVESIAAKREIDVIHAHDWMTFPAGIAAKKKTNKPLITHIHNTAFDRSGGNPNPYEYQIEFEGFTQSDKILAVSNFVRQTIIQKYNIPPEKIEIVHNGIDLDNYKHTPERTKIDKQIVLFAGRVTLQKGPDYFVQVAEKISQKRDDIQFILAGNGDMLPQVIDMVAERGLSKRFIFPGKYTKEEGERLMNMADVFVMPSVSEPFGLVPLEAMIQKTPAIISKQSGVSEVITHALRTDFWDVHQLANKILSVLQYSALHEQLSEYGHQEVQTKTWDPAAKKCKEIYRSVKW